MNFEQPHGEKGTLIIAQKKKHVLHKLLSQGSDIQKIHIRNTRGIQSQRA